MAISSSSKEEDAQEEEEADYQASDAQESQTDIQADFLEDIRNLFSENQAVELSRIQSMEQEENGEKVTKGKLTEDGACEGEKQRLQEAE